MQEMQIRSLGRDDPLEEEMATHSSIVAWRIPWTEEPGGLLSMGSQRVKTRLSNWTRMNTVNITEQGIWEVNSSPTLKADFGLQDRKWKWSRSVLSDSLWPHGL